MPLYVVAVVVVVVGLLVMNVININTDWLLAYCNTMAVILMAPVLFLTAAKGVQDVK